MNRTIKFRAWDTETKKLYKIVLDISFWADGKIQYVVATNDLYGEKKAETIWGENLILEQFAGLFDKKRTKQYPNGQPIYEGDIVYFYIGDKYPGKGIVAYWKDRFCIVDGLDVENSAVYFSIYGRPRTRVIGNIHDNPELLNG